MLAPQRGSSFPGRIITKCLPAFYQNPSLAATSLAATRDIQFGCADFSHIRIDGDIVIGEEAKAYAITKDL